MAVDIPILSVQGEADIQSLAAVLKNLADYWDPEYDPSPDYDYADEAHDIASVVYAAGWRPSIQ